MFSQTKLSALLDRGRLSKTASDSSLHPHVDVSGVDPAPRVTVKRASRHALRGRYPIDSYEQVKRASSYFEEHRSAFAPADRREFCVSLTKRAEEIGIELPDEIRKYGSAGYAPDEEIDLALFSRSRLLGPESRYAAAVEKIASMRASLSPEDFCATLEEFDKVAGIDAYYSHGDVFDPYYSTYGFVKQAEFSETIGADTVNETQLKKLTRQRELLLKTFDEDFCKEFGKDPVGIFKSLPREQKIIVMRLAKDDSSTSGSVSG